MIKILISFLVIFSYIHVSAQDNQEILRIKILDEHEQPVFGVYVSNPKKALLLTASDMDGECLIHLSSCTPSDTLQFQGIGYISKKITLQNLKKSPVIHLKELKYELDEARVMGIPAHRLLEIVTRKLKKEKTSRIPLCRYYGPAQYEKITQCRDTVVEYRKEYGLYFTSGNIRPYNFWDRTFRSYIVPQYIARSYNLSTDAKDTLVPVFLTAEKCRYDMGTRKIFTLLRAIQLYGPLFSELKYYDIQPIETDSLDYIFSFKTLPEAYPDQTRISCKGTFTIDREDYYLKKMEFDYIDYQLLRQILLSDQRKTASPFSTKATLTFALDSTKQHFVSSCFQTTTWKYDLNENFVLIEEPSRDLPGLNRLVEQEAFRYYEQRHVRQELQNNSILAKIHLAHRFPTGTYSQEIFDQLPQLLDISKACQDLNRYMLLKDQFIVHDNKPYYPKNYLSDSDIDFREQANYLRNLSETRKQLFRLFNSPPFSVPGLHIQSHQNK